MTLKIPAGICTPGPLPPEMMPDLEEVPRLRKALGLTQTALARLSNVSQSTIEQIETRKVQYVEAKIPLATAVDEMRHWKFSQMPVMHNGHPVGSISDKVINNLILSGKDPKDLARIRVDEVMEPAFPQVDSKAPVELAASLLRHYNAVLVTAKGEVTGIVTKSDLMKLL